MKFLTWLNQHKTKITGAVLVAIGAVQANATMLQPLMSPHSYALAMVLAGVVVAVLGFLNSRSPS